MSSISANPTFLGGGSSFYDPPHLYSEVSQVFYRNKCNLPISCESGISTQLQWRADFCSTKELSVLYQHCSWQEREPWTANSTKEAVTYQQVSGNKDSTGARAELPHDQVSLFLVHVTVLKRRNEILQHVPKVFPHVYVFTHHTNKRQRFVPEQKL